MSGRPAVESIEPFLLAAQGRILEGSFGIAGMERLAPLIRSTEGRVNYHLQFDRDEGGIPCIKGSVTATLVLQCQRCMQDMPFLVHGKVRLGIISTQQSAEQLPGDYEPLIVTDKEIPLVSIVEDELILALPIVAMHQPGECSIEAPQFLSGADTGTDRAAQDVTAPDKYNPFAILETLKSQPSSGDAEKIMTSKDEE